MNKHQEALDNIRELKTKMYVDFVYRVATKGSMIQLESAIDDNLNTIQELVNEKIEQESRKDKLVEGSKWVCELDNKAQEFGNYKPHVENIKKGLIVEVFNVNGLIIFGHDKSMESWVIGEEQFIACFRPLKEGEKE